MVLFQKNEMTIMVSSNVDLIKNMIHLEIKKDR